MRIIPTLDQGEVRLAYFGANLEVMSIQDLIYSKRSAGRPRSRSPGLSICSRSSTATTSKRSVPPASPPPIRSSSAHLSGTPRHARPATQRAPQVAPEIRTIEDYRRFCDFQTQSE